MAQKPKTEAGRIAAAARATEQRIRAYCRSQRKLWMEIPYLALEADGRSGFSDQLSEAMHFQLWRLSVPPYPNAQMFVCLYTGRLVALHDTSKLADPDDVRRLASHMELIDARKIAAELRRDAGQPLSNLITPRSEAEKRKIRRALEWVPQRGEVAMGFEGNE